MRRWPTDRSRAPRSETEPPTGNRRALLWILVIVVAQVGVYLVLEYTEPVHMRMDYEPPPGSTSRPWR